MHDILFHYSTKPYFCCISFFGRVLLKCYYHVWILRLVSPCMVVLCIWISAQWQLVLSQYFIHYMHLLIIYFCEVLLELALFTVSCLWIVYCFYIGVVHVVSTISLFLCQFLKVLVPFRWIFLVLQEIAWELAIDNSLCYIICSLLYKMS